MKRALLIAMALTLAVPVILNARPKTRAEADFERMKSLEGVWEGKSPDGTDLRISYQVISAGSAVMEEIGHGGMHEGSSPIMVTMYHLDGDRLMMTHYCSAGNQPRMKVVSSTDNALTYEMFDATNLKSGNDAHMRKVTFTWADKDHITTAWVMSKDGKDDPHGVFTLARKK